MTIVYTTIFGGSDSLKPAPEGADECVCFVDDASRYPDSLGWDIQEWNTGFDAYACERVNRKPFDLRRLAWHMRCVPQMLFDYDRVVWVDASFTLMNLPKLLKDAGTAPIAALRHHERNSPYWEAARLVKVGQSKIDDVAPQLAAYHKAQFSPTHLSISCILVRDRSKAVQKFNETWDAEIRRWPGDNTQVSLDYAAWKAGLEIKALKGTRLDNPYATHDVKDHQARRRPYLQEANQ